MSGIVFHMPFARSHTCGQLGRSDVGKEVRLTGWVSRVRDLGGLRFIRLRDRYGEVQLLVDPKDEELGEKSGSLRMEDVIACKGRVSLRPEDMIRDDSPTGAIEVRVEELIVLNRSKVLPFTITDEVKANEDLRLKYRYLDLRRRPLKENIELRHKVVLAIRNFLASKGFLEIETPMLVRCTPEGARDYLVPSRLHPGCFYALPQSPQLYKQILMVAGFDRYFQIARCLRDEDLRADRQPEHTQIDIEMSFVTEDDVFRLGEELMQETFRVGRGIALQAPFPRLSYEEAIERYGTDKPDLRLGMELVTLDACFEGSDFRVVGDVLGAGGIVRGFKVLAGERLSGKQLRLLDDEARGLGAGGLIHLKLHDGSLRGPASKFLSAGVQSALMQKLSMGEGDALLAVAGASSVVTPILGRLRAMVGEMLPSADPDDFRFLWVNDFPLFEWDEERECIAPSHHLFSMPKEEDLHFLDEDPLRVRATLYDLVCNGVELASGSIRVHSRDLQERIMGVAGISRQEARRRFGFLLEALEYGAPPHGGIAPGLDRILMILSGGSSIREVIAFPKTQKAASLMDEAPSPVDKEQLEDLHIRVIEEDEGESPDTST